jgi:hypothetical protein
MFTSIKMLYARVNRSFSLASIVNRPNVNDNEWTWVRGQDDIGKMWVELIIHTAMYSKYTIEFK